MKGKSIQLIDTLFPKFAALLIQQSIFYPGGEIGRRAGLEGRVNIAFVRVRPPPRVQKAFLMKIEKAFFCLFNMA